MALDSWLAGIGGALGGVQVQHNRDEDRDLEQRKIDASNELRLMLEQLRQEGQTGRTNATNQTRTEIAGQTSADRRYGVDTRAATAATAETGRGQRATMRNTTANRALDMSDEHYWDNAARDWDLGWGRINATTRGQDIGAATSRRGQDMSQATTERGQDLSHEDRQDSIDATGDARAMGYAVRAYGQELQRRKQGSSLFGDQTDQLPTFEKWLQDSDDPEIFPSVKRMFQAPAAVAPASNGAPAARPPIPGARVPRPAAAPGALEAQAKTLVQQIRELEAAGKDATAQRAQLATLRKQVK